MKKLIYNLFKKVKNIFLFVVKKIYKRKVFNLYWNNIYFRIFLKIVLIGILWFFFDINDLFYNRALILFYFFIILFIWRESLLFILYFINKFTFFSDYEVSNLEYFFKKNRKLNNFGKWLFLHINLYMYLLYLKLKFIKLIKIVRFFMIYIGFFKYWFFIEKFFYFIFEKFVGRGTRIIFLYYFKFKKNLFKNSYIVIFDIRLLGFFFLFLFQGLILIKIVIILFFFKLIWMMFMEIYKKEYFKENFEVYRSSKFYKSSFLYKRINVVELIKENSIILKYCSLNNYIIKDLYDQRYINFFERVLYDSNYLFRFNDVYGGLPLIYLLYWNRHFQDYIKFFMEYMVLFKYKGINNLLYNKLYSILYKYLYLWEYLISYNKSQKINFTFLPVTENEFYPKMILKIDNSNFFYSNCYFDKDFILNELVVISNLWKNLINDYNLDIDYCLRNNNNELIGLPLELINYFKKEQLNIINLLNKEGNYLKPVIFFGRENFIKIQKYFDNELK